jgi:hypothetical protein
MALYQWVRNNHAWLALKACFPPCPRMLLGINLLSHFTLIPKIGPIVLTGMCAQRYLLQYLQFSFEQ